MGMGQQLRCPNLLEIRSGFLDCSFRVRVRSGSDSVPERNQMTEREFNVLETFLHTCYYYGLSAYVGLGIVRLARALGFEPLDMLSQYLKDEKVKANVDEILRTTVP